MSTSSFEPSAYIAKIEQTQSVEDLRAIEHELFGRKEGLLTVAMKGLQKLSGAEKKQTAVELNSAKEQLANAIAQKTANLTGVQSDTLQEQDALDVTLELPKKHYGHLHPIPEFIAQVEDVFGRMGFDVAYGPEIETEDYNFNKLNIPDDHPARDSQDTFTIENSKKTVLRTHTSPVQIRYMETHKPPFRMICPGKVYRKDSDATHSPMFHQFEGLMVGDDVSLANLQAILVNALRELIGRDVEFRFRTGYFPFVEPGLEMDMMWQGDLQDSREGKWLEMGGCGMVHPKVLENVGIDPNIYQGFAFGFGIERPLMIKHQVPDLRAFYQGDVRFLQQF